MERVETVVVGAGLAGLTCGLDLAEAGRDVLILEARDVVGGRCSSWVDDGMPVETGYHRMIGAYTALPDVMDRVGVDWNDFLCWEDELEIRSSDGSSGVLGASPLHRPARTMFGPVSAASPVSAPEILVGAGRAVLDAAPVHRAFTSPVRHGVLDPLDMVGEGLNDLVDAWPSPVRELALPLVERGLLSPADLASLGPFFTAGFAAYETAPHRLDRWSVRRMARRFRVSRRALKNILDAATAGLFFSRPEDFSAANLFGIVHASTPQLHRQRLGAFTGGMTEVMCQPLADGAVRGGAEVRTGVAVAELLEDAGRIHGVRTTEGLRIEADHVVLATALGAAQDLLRPRYAGDRWFEPILTAPTTPEVNVQFELDRPADRLDRTVFGPGTCVGNFAEQSRTTFRHVPGRCQVTLAPSHHFIDMPDEWVAKRAVDGLRRLDIDIADSITDYRVLSQPRDFLSLEPGNLYRRPPNRTPVPGLTLAGDYTDQKWLSLMEGAVRSGQSAARIVLERGTSEYLSERSA